MAFAPTSSPQPRTFIEGDARSGLTLARSLAPSLSLSVSLSLSHYVQRFFPRSRSRSRSLLLYHTQQEGVGDLVFREQHYCEHREGGGLENSAEMSRGLDLLTHRLAHLRVRSIERLGAVQAERRQAVGCQSRLLWINAR